MSGLGTSARSSNPPSGASRSIGKTPACRAGGRGFESRRSRLAVSSCTIPFELPPCDGVRNPSRDECVSHVGRRAQRRDERVGPSRLAALGGRRALARVERGRRADRASRSVRRRQHDPDDAAGRRACRAAHRRSHRARAVRRRGRRRRLRRPHDTPGRGLGDERSRITYRMEITGPAAETVGPEIGPEISGDFPEVLAALAARAE
jgi:hypothetical protein